MIHRRAVLACSVGAALLLCAPELLAWDGPTHLSIVRTAFVLSPVAETRVPREHRDAFFGELEQADLADRICRYHRGPSALKDPAAEVAQAFARLLKGGQKPYERARTVGRFLHYVGDLAVPAPIASGAAYRIANFWVNRDFVVFRERHGTGAALPETLRTAGLEAQWADDTPEAYPGIFRLAVNLTIDALLALPPDPAASAPVDEGPVLFMVNRQDSGLSGTRTGYVSVVESDRRGNAIFYIAELRSGGQGSIKMDLMRRRGVQVVEIAARQQATSTSVRSLLFNNLDEPSCGVELRAGRWSRSVPGTFQPGELRMVSAEIPAGIRGEMTASSRIGSCPGEIAPDAIPSTRRLVLGNAGEAPRFDTFEAVAMGAPRSAVPAGIASRVGIKGDAKQVFEPEPRAGVLMVTFEPAAERQLDGILTVSSFKMRTDRAGWQFRLTATNSGKAALEWITFVMSVTSEGSAVPRQLPVTFDFTGFEPGKEMELKQAVTGWGTPVSFRVTQVKRPGTSGAPEIRNQVPLSR